MFSFFNKNKRLLKQAEKGNTRAVLRLLNRGADVNSTDEDGFSPLIEALRWQHQDTAEALKAAGATLNLTEAAYCGQSDLVRRHLAEGPTRMKEQPS